MESRRCAFPLPPVRKGIDRKRSWYYYSLKSGSQGGRPQGGHFEPVGAKMRRPGEKLGIVTVALAAAIVLVARRAAIADTLFQHAMTSSNTGVNNTYRYLIYDGLCVTNTPADVSYAVGASDPGICITAAARDRDGLRGRYENFGQCFSYSWSVAPGTDPCSGAPVTICTVHVSSQSVDPGSPLETSCPAPVCRAPAVYVPASPGIAAGPCNDNFDFCDRNAPAGVYEGVLGILDDPDKGAELVSRCLPPGSLTEHYLHVRGDELTTVSGLVAGGRSGDDGVCPTGLSCRTPADLQAETNGYCSYPNVSGEDYALHHIDRDFEFHIFPLKSGVLDGSLLNSANFALKDGGGLPVLGVEVEYMYFYPRQGPYQTVAATDANGNPVQIVGGAAHAGVSLVGNNLPPSASRSDGWRADFPTVGDQVTTTGVLIWDCGHLTQGAFHTEIHPPVATAWLHARPDATGGRLVVKALSHAGMPSGTHPPFPRAGFQAAFQVPSYRSDQPVCIDGPILDYNATKAGPGALADNHDIATDYVSKSPEAVLLAAPDSPIAGTWSLELKHEDSSLTVNLWLIQEPAGVEPEFPLMLGAHFDVCQPGVSASGANVTCPGSCYVSTATIMTIIDGLSE
jgi:hypothetical protein